MGGGDLGWARRLCGLVLIALVATPMLFCVAPGGALAQEEPPDRDRWVPPRRRAAPADTTAPGGTLLERLRQQDDAFYDPELLEFDTVFRDSVTAALDSTGLEAYSDDLDRRGRRFDLDFGLADRLLDYNRTEGLVAGLSTTVRPLGSRGPALGLQGAYATASEQWRHLETVGVPVELPRGRLTFFAYYRDRVEAYGSNAPGWNGVRALVAGDDERDYLRRRGGGAGIDLTVGSRERPGAVRLRLAYDAARETSVPGAGDFSVFGRLDPFNAAIEEGIDRALVVGASAGSVYEDGWRVEGTMHLAGSELGGDFQYGRADLAFGARRYLFGGHEAVLDLGVAATADDPPSQRLADLGGMTTIRGFDRRTRVGETSLHARLEYFVPFDLFRAARVPFLEDRRIQFVPWADAGRVWGATPAPIVIVPWGTAASDADRAAFSTRWLTSAGLGLQYYLGPFPGASHLRLDLAFPTGPDRPDDVRVYLRLVDVFRFAD